MLSLGSGKQCFGIDFYEYIIHKQLETQRRKTLFLAAIVFRMVTRDIRLVSVRLLLNEFIEIEQ